MNVRSSGLALTLVLLNAASVAAQGTGLPRRNQISLDIGVLEAGISYARRLGHGPVSLGGGLRGAWEPWNTFEQSLFQPAGAELFVRVRPSAAAQFEFGPSLLGYRWADDCSECSGTFAGLHAAGGCLLEDGPYLQQPFTPSR